MTSLQAEEGATSGMYVVNYALNPKILGRKTKSRPGLVDPLEYYLS